MAALGERPTKGVLPPTNIIARIDHVNRTDRRGERKKKKKKQEVLLHIYDVTIMHINKIFKDGMGIGGIFHCAIQGFLNIYQVYGDDEWSFGFCEHLLSRNCSHFCDEFCERLGVPKPSGWVNRFANAGDAAVEVTENRAVRFRQAKTEIVTASKVAHRFLMEAASHISASPDSPGNLKRGTPRLQAAWFRNLIKPGEKPYSSAEVDKETDGVLGSNAKLGSEGDSAVLLRQKFGSPM